MANSRFQSLEGSAGSTAALCCYKALQISGKRGSWWLPSQNTAVVHTMGLKQGLACCLDIGLRLECCHLLCGLSLSHTAICLMWLGTPLGNDTKRDCVWGRGGSDLTGWLGILISVKQSLHCHARTAFVDRCLISCSCQLPVGCQLSTCCQLVAGS